MIINVNHGVRQAIENVAKDAAVSFRENDATLAITMDNLISTPLVGQRITLAGESWEVVRLISHTSRMLTFLCRRGDA